MFSTAPTCLISNIERSLDIIGFEPLSVDYLREWSLNGLDIGGSPDIDSHLYRMDSGSDSDGPEMPFMGPSSYDFSQQSTGRSDELRPGQSVKLVVPRFGDVGIGSVVDVNPSGQWLGVCIPPGSSEFILVRPSSIVSDAENLFLEPRRGVAAL